MTDTAANLDDKYMYEFCTKRCTWKECPKDATCFDAHTKVMCRRPPKQIWSMGGLFNYIPEHCPQYKWKKKCSSGDNCFRAHGWLEVIFHPLLYKTKLCKSTHEDGACRLYGIYCAKAHKRNEMRNLAKIYGKNWKMHYEISKREVLQKFLGGLGKAVINECGKPRLTAGLTVPTNSKGKYPRLIGSNDVSDYQFVSPSVNSSFQSLTSESSDTLPSQASMKSAHYLNVWRTEQAEEQINDYTDLYSTELVEVKSKPDAVRAFGESLTLFKCQLSPRKISRVPQTANISTNCWPFFSWEQDTVNYLDKRDEINAKLYTNERNLLGGRGVEKSFGGKLLKQSERKRQNELGAARSRTCYR